MAAAWIRAGRVLAARRGPGRARAGLWELPGGKVEPGESDADALRREIHEELGVRVDVHEVLGESVHRYPELTIRLVALRCTSPATPTTTEHAELRWVDAEALTALDWAPADRPLLPPVAARLAAYEP